jgi:hypothetical protein
VCERERKGQTCGIGEGQERKRVGRGCERKRRGNWQKLTIEGEKGFFELQKVANATPIDSAMC